jgi:hypothetical protein
MSGSSAIERRRNRAAVVYEQPGGPYECHAGSAYSDEVGQHQSEATLVMAMITEDFSQVFFAW